MRQEVLRLQMSYVQNEKKKKNGEVAHPADRRPESDGTPNGNGLATQAISPSRARMHLTVLINVIKRKDARGGETDGVPDPVGVGALAARTDDRLDVPGMLRTRGKHMTCTTHKQD